MNYYVYIIQNEGGRYYFGHTKNIFSRILRHNQGGVRSTKYGIPWTLVYSEHFKTRSEAYRRELEIKSYKGGILFRKLLNK